MNSFNNLIDSSYSLVPGHSPRDLMGVDDEFLEHNYGLPRHA